MKNFFVPPLVVQGAFGPLKIGPSRAPGGQGIRKKVLVHKTKITYLMVPDNFAFMKKNALFYNPNVCLSVCASVRLSPRKSAVTF